MKFYNHMMKYKLLLLITFLIFKNSIKGQDHQLIITNNQLNNTYDIVGNYNILFDPKLIDSISFDAKIDEKTIVTKKTINELYDTDIKGKYYPIIKIENNSLTFSSQERFDIKEGSILTLKLHEFDKEVKFNIKAKKADKPLPVEKESLKIDSSLAMLLRGLSDIKELGSKQDKKILLFNTGDNILSDAYYLMSKDNSPDNKELLLKKYNLVLTDLSDSSNIFLAKYRNIKGIELNSSKEQYLSKIAKTDVTNFATGMSRFLVDRAKAELNDAFFQRMYAEMDKVADLQFLFPQTYFFLRQINVHNIQLNLEQLKTKFEEDMKNLPVNLYNSKYQLDENKYAFLKSINQFLETPIGAWVDMGLYSLISNHGKINPKDLLESFVHSPAAKELKERLTRSLNNYTVDRTDAIPIAKVDVLATHNQLNLLSTIKLVELISNSLLSPEEDRYWVPMQEVEELIKNDALFETYIGLLLAKSEFEQYKISFYKKDGTSISLKHLTESAYKQGTEAKIYLDNLKSMIKELFYTLSKIDDLGKELKAANSSEELIHEVYKYYSVLKDNVTILNAHLGFRGTIGNTTIDIDQAPLFQYLIPCIDIAYNIKSKQYNLAISNVITLLSYVQEHNAKHKKSTAKESAAVLKKLARYGTLIGSVAQAKTSDEVKAAIEASVLPVGSSRIKRHSRYSISLNAYVGAFYGQGFYKEEVNGLLENKTVQTFGITAPIGVSFNKGGLGFKQKSSLSLTMQVIDLGALVNFYAKNGDGASLPANTKIQLGDILAPGAQLTYSLGDSPFSIIGGIQYVPNLSRMSEISSNTNFTPIAYRAQIGLVIDIPLFNLKVWEK